MFMSKDSGMRRLLGAATQLDRSNRTDCDLLHYGFVDLVEMEEAWRNWVTGASTKSFKERTMERSERLAQAPPPETALCIAEDGQIAVLQPTTKKLSLHAAKNVQAFELDGAPIEMNNLLKMLKKETAVLLADDGKVEPIYLRPIKAGTIILVLPQTLPPPREVIGP